MFGRNKQARYPANTTTITSDAPIHVTSTNNNSHHAHTHSTKPSLMSRLRARKTAPRAHTATTTAPRRSGRSTFGRRNQGTTTTAPVVRQRRKPSLGDKISGAMLKLKGSAEHKPGKKAAGTRRMHGTDGKGAKRYY